jgi:HAD superfamily hydrolase (TIGR01549 family)
MPTQSSGTNVSEEMIDATLADSFPASDPPSWTLGRERARESVEPLTESATESRTQTHHEHPSGSQQRNRLNERLRGPAFLFDLDGTLVDSVYQHVLAWREALEASGFELAVWRIHRRIGMSGGLFVNALLRETGQRVTAEEAVRLQRLHTDAYLHRVNQVRPLPGARELLAYLTQAGIPWAIATSGREESAHRTLEVLGLSSGVPVITRDQVEHAKPDPDLFLAAAERLGIDIGDSVVVGDSVWDLLAARRARTLGVGLLSGGYGEDELERAGAYRVYEDPADLLNHLDEVGVRPAV